MTLQSKSKMENISTKDLEEIIGLNNDYFCDKLFVDGKAEE